MSHSVVITGLGAISAAGTEVAEHWQLIKQGQSALKPLGSINGDEWEYNLGGEVNPYKPRDWLRDKKLLKVISRQDVFGLYAAQQAIDSSGVIAFRDQLADASEFNDRSGIYVASPGNKYFQQYDFLPLMAESGGDMKKFADKLFEQVHPMWLLKILPNNVLAYVGIQNAFKGPNQNVTNHVVSGHQAFLEAQWAIQQGLIDRAIVVGYDSATEPQGYVYYGAIGALSKSSVRPFDERRDGTILAEGACAFLLEREDLAKQRNAKIYARCLGGASFGDAAGIFSLQEQGQGQQRAIQKALAACQLNQQDIGFITAHANATDVSDRIEAHAIYQLFADKTPVTGFKWAIGHTLAAAGLFDCLFSVLALQDKLVPGIASFNKRASDCAPIAVSSDQQTPNSDIALVLSRGFGSLHSSVLLQAV